MKDKYLDYIKQVAYGTMKMSLEEFLHPEIAKKRWFTKYKAIRENQTKVNADLAERNQ